MSLVIYCQRLFYFYALTQARHYVYYDDSIPLFVKWIKRILVFILILYVLGLGVLYVYQERLLFKPFLLDQQHVYRKGEEVNFHVEKSVTINGLWLKEENSKGAIIYLHGNKGNIRRCIVQAEAFQGTGYDVLLIDYRGFGKSEGTITSESQMKNDVQKVYNDVKSLYGEKNIIISGYSMGTGLASFLAAANRPKQLFLISPYYSIPWLINRYIPIIPGFAIKYKFDNSKELRKVSCPIVVIHGSNDEVIPIENSYKLNDLGLKNLKVIPLQSLFHKETILSSELRRTFKNEIL